MNRIKRNPCTVEGCTNPIFAKKLCLHHQYKRTDKKPSALSSQPSEKVSKKPICKSNSKDYDKRSVPKKQKPIAKISEKQKRRLIKYRIIRDQYFKTHPVCQYPGCESRDITLHHMCGRQGALLYNSKYFKSLCWEHHQWCEFHPLAAKVLGLSGDRLDK